MTREERNARVLELAPVIRRIARSLAPRFSGVCESSDLEQAGCLAVILALDRGNDVRPSRIWGAVFDGGRAAGWGTRAIPLPVRDLGWIEDLDEEHLPLVPDFAPEIDADLDMRALLRTLPQARREALWRRYWLDEVLDMAGWNAAMWGRRALRERLRGQQGAA